MALDGLMRNLISGHVDDHAEFIRIVDTYGIGKTTIKQRVMEVLDAQAVEVDKGKRTTTDIGEALRSIENSIISTMNQLGEEIPKVAGGSIHATGGGRPGKTSSGPRE